MFGYAAISNFCPAFFNLTTEIFVRICGMQGGGSSGAGVLQPGHVTIVGQHHSLHAAECFCATQMDRWGAHLLAHGLRDGHL